MWSGTIAPTGWMICNGDPNPKTGKNVPDLRGRFVVGYHKDKTDYNTIGNTGGANSVTLEEGQLPPHNHIFTTDKSALGKFNNIETSFPQKVKDTSEAQVSAEGNGKGYAYYTTKTGKEEAHENRPPFYVLAYIIKI